MPYGQHLKPSSVDRQNFGSILEKSLSLACLRKVSRLLNQNKNENLHHRIFTYCLKHALWSRNLEAFVYSALHSDVYGTGLSCLLLGKAIGILPSKRGPMFRHMLRRDYRTQYCRQLKSSPRYKQKRIIARKLKTDRKLLQGPFYTHCDEKASIEHAYGMNPRK